MSIEKWLEKNSLLLKAAIWIFYLTVSFIFLFQYTFYSTDDTVSYINIAKNYSEGYLKDAINAYWSPLISWLMVPFIKVGLNEFYALKLVNIFSGIICLVACEKIFLKLTKRPHLLVLLFLQITLSLLLISYQTTIPSPDVLAAAFVLSYTYSLLQRDYKTAGILGALSYFAKAYNFFFFIFSYFSILLFELFIHKNRFSENLKKYFIGLLLFLIVSGAWIFIIYLKYDKITVSTAGPYNTTVVQPDGSSIQYDLNRIIPPPNKHATSSWYDPGYYPVKARTPFKSLSDFKEYVDVIMANIRLFNYYMSSMSYFKILWLLMLPVFIYFVSSNNKKDLVVLYLFCLVYISGYILILIEERYLLFPYFIFTMITFAFASFCIQKYPRFKFLIIAIPLIVIGKNSIITINTFFHRSTSLKENYRLTEQHSSLNYFKNTNWISDSPSKEFYILAYLSNSNYCGFCKPENITSSLTEGIKLSDLDYYISFEDNVPENTVYVQDLDFYYRTAKLYRFVKDKK